MVYHISVAFQCIYGHSEVECGSEDGKEGEREDCMLWMSGKQGEWGMIGVNGGG